MDFEADEERGEWFERNLEERFRTRRWVGKSFYAEPDYEDLGGKAWFAIKFGSALGIGVGVMNSYGISPVSHALKDKFFKFSKGFLPTLFCANVFAFTTYVVANIRKKDDMINHAVGGLAAGTVVGAACKNYGLGAAAMLALATAGVALKFSEINDFPIAPSPTGKYHSSFFMRKFDTTLYKDDIRGNWTREPKVN